MHELAFHGVVTYILPIKAFVNRSLITWLFSSKAFVRLIYRQKHSNASLVSEKTCWLV